MKKIFTLAAFAVFALAASAQYVTNPSIGGKGVLGDADKTTRELSGTWDGTAPITAVIDPVATQEKGKDTYYNEYEVISISAKANNVYVIGCAGSKLMMRAITAGGETVAPGSMEAQTEVASPNGNFKYMTSEATTQKDDAGLTVEFGGVTYDQATISQGSTNVMSWAVQPAADGNLDIAIKMGGNKKTYVIEIDAAGYEAEAGDALTLAGAYALAGGSGLCSDFQALVVPTAVEAVAEAKAEAKAPVKVITANGVQIGNFNIAGQQVK